MTGSGERTTIPGVVVRDMGTTPKVASGYRVRARVH